MNKQLIISIIFLVLAASCRAPMHGVIRTMPTPYVRLKNGTVHHCNNVGYTIDETTEGHWGKVEYYNTVHKPRIHCGDSAYKFAEVAAFCNGNNFFGNINGKRFAMKFGEGKINTYATIRSKNVPLAPSENDVSTFKDANYFADTGFKDFKGFSFPTRKGRTTPHFDYYIGKGDTGMLFKYKYANLRKMIPPDAQAALYLNRFGLIRTITGITTLAGLGILVEGTTLATNAQSNFATQLLGNILSYSGFAIAGSSLIVRYRNHKNLRRALYMYNGTKY